MIEINKVSKTFGKNKVLNEISLEVRNGEIVGYVGLNGTGKTTTIRVAVGVPLHNGILKSFRSI